jgi:sec-independent protein translocase protein TatC
VAKGVVRPIGHEDRLSLVDHLGELRTRLTICIIAVLVAFVVCYAKNDDILHFINKPLETTQNANSNKRSNDPIEQSARFQREIGGVLRQLGPALAGVSASLRDLSGADGVTAGARAAVAQRARALERAQKAVASAASAVPTNTARQPITIGVAEPFTVTFTVAIYAALLLAMPILLFQAYSFVLPAFSPQEKRTALPLMLMVPFLFVSGVVFAYFVALPRAINFLQNFNDDNFDILVQARDYYKFSILFMAAVGLLFQIPVGVLALTRLGVVSTRQLRKNRGYVVLALAVIAAVATPTPDPVTMLFALGPLLFLFEFSVLLARFLERNRPEGPSRWSWPDDDDDELADEDAELGGELDDEEDAEDPAEVFARLHAHDDYDDEEDDDDADDADDEHGPAPDDPARPPVS